MRTDQNAAAVTTITIHEGCASLTVNYKTRDLLGRETSDEVRFECLFGEHLLDPVTEAEAIADVLEQARQWAGLRRLEGFELSAWDSAGNSY